MLWALYDAPTDEAQSTLILVALAENASDNGTAAWPSISTIARKARCSERTVHRKLRELEELRLIRRGDQRHVAHLDGRYRPVVYDLALHRSRGDRLSPLGGFRGDTAGHPGVTPLADEPSLEPKPPIRSPQPAAAVDDADPHWQRFWSLYPKKIGKGAARRSWARALRKVDDPEVLIAAARRFAGHADDLRYVPYPSTWLNQERWLDATGATPTEGRRRNVSSKDEECPVHAGEHRDHCRGCAADEKAAG